MAIDHILNCIFGKPETTDLIKSNVGGVSKKYDVEVVGKLYDILKNDTNSNEYYHYDREWQSSESNRCLHHNNLVFLFEMDCDPIGPIESFDVYVVDDAFDIHSDKYAKFTHLLKEQYPRVIENNTVVKDGPWIKDLDALIIRLDLYGIYSREIEDRNARIMQDTMEREMKKRQSDMHKQNILHNYKPQQDQSSNSSQSR